MKKIWLILVFICGCLSLRAQSISVKDMMNIINLPEDEAKGYLSSKGFKLKVISQSDGFTVSQFEVNDHGRQETVIYGKNIRARDGKILHTIRYSTNTSPYMAALIKDAPQTGLHLDFQGNDNSKKIYFYNSALYRASIYDNLDHTFGLIEIREKDMSGG